MFGSKRTVIKNCSQLCMLKGVLTAMTLLELAISASRQHGHRYRRHHRGRQQHVKS